MELSELGGCGQGVTIHPSALFFNPKHVHIGDNVRIDCFCVISAGDEGVHLGSHIHLAPGVMIFGASGRVTLEDFTGLSSRVAVYTATDDFLDGYLAGPQIPDAFRKVRKGPVTLRKHAIVGAGSIIMPGVELKEGASVGALTFVSRSVPEYTVVSGSPMRRVTMRNRARVQELEQLFLKGER